MTPSAHLLLSWLSSVEILENRRDRSLVALSGVAPDLDGLGLIVDKIIGGTDYYFQYHHYIGHSIFTAIAISFVASFFAKAQKVKVWCLSLFVVHLHIICDIIGSKGPDGYQWPIYYFYPLLPKYGITWQYQWELNGWQNFVILFFFLCVSVYYAVKKKITVLEVFSKRLNSEVFNMYKKYVLKNA